MAHFTSAEFKDYLYICVSCCFTRSVACSDSSVSLHRSPFQFSFAFFMHLLMLLFTSLYFSDPSGLNLFFLSSLLLSHRSKTSPVPPGFLFCWCLPRISPAVSVTAMLCAEGGDHWIQVCVFIVHDGERCKFPTYHSLVGFEHIGIFQLFEFKLESCVFWLADFFQAKVEGHHQQVVVTSNVCPWKTSCSGYVHSWSEALPN